VLTLFLVEYLNPSAIGVRADFNPAPAGSPAQERQNSPNTQTSSATPHSMIKTEAFQAEGSFPCQDLFASIDSIIEQTNEKEIFHPPALTL
jgi:hypothetical protein